MDEELVTPEVVDESDLVIQANRRHYQKLAQTSWLSAPIAFMANLWLQSSARHGDPKLAGTLNIVYLSLFALAGCVSIAIGVVALLNVRRYGKEKILLPAISGIVVWLLMFAMFVALFLAAIDYAKYRKRTASAPAFTSLAFAICHERIESTQPRR